MRVVANNSEQDIARAEAERKLIWPLRELASNMMRVVRGAGKPHEIGPQAATVLQIYETYREAWGHYPPSDLISRVLDWKPYDPEGRWDEWEEGQETMVRGALQIAASALVGQAAQQAAGRSQLSDGLRAVDRLREKRRKQMLTTQLAERAKTRKKKPPKS